MDNNVQNIRSGRALAGFGKFFSGLGLVIAAIGAILGGAVPVIIEDDQAWRLLALTGGAPMLVFGEWESTSRQGRWRLLSAWQNVDAGSAEACIWICPGDVA